MTHDLAMLLDGMASADPSVRDGWALEELADGIAGGRFAREHERIRDCMIRHLASRQVQARTFAPLVLLCLVEAGDRDRAAFDHVVRWYVGEDDTRGWDDDLGWLHAVAHGADYLGGCVTAGIATGAEVLDVLAARMLRSGDAWRDHEDARVARTAVLALRDCDEAESGGWLDRVRDQTARETDRTGRVPGWVHNTYATCTTLYAVLTARPDPRIPHGARDAPAEAIFTITPWLDPAG